MTIARRLWVDLTTGVVSDNLNTGSNIGDFRLKARDTSVFGIQFHRSGVPELLDAGSTLTLGIKLTGDYGGDFLASSTSFTAATSVNASSFTSSDFYRSTLSLNTSAIISAIGDESDSLACIGEIQVDIGGSGQFFSSRTIPVTIDNDIIRGSEGVPLSGSPSYPDPLEIIRYKTDISSLTGGTSVDLDGIPTTTLATPFAIAFNNADSGTDVWQIYTLKASTASTVVSAGIIRPLDFATSTNEKVWFWSNDVGSTTDHNTLINLSADSHPQYLLRTDVNTLTSDWNEAYTEVSTNSATWNQNFDGSLVESTSANWNSVYTSFNANSANYPNENGESGGQIITGGTGSGDSLELRSTSHGTKGAILIGDGDYLEVGNITAPGSPSANRVRIYASSNALYAKDTNGTISPIAGVPLYKNILLTPDMFGNYSTTAATLATLPLGTTGTNGKYVRSWAFDDTSSEYIDISFPVPHDMDVSQNLNIKLTWSQNHTNTGNVVWEVYSWYNGFGADGTVYPGTAGADNTETTIDPSTGRYYINVTAAKSIADGGNIALGDLIHMRIGRLATSGSDTMTGDALLLFATLQYCVTPNITPW